jgi:hypothetical protein
VTKKRESCSTREVIPNRPVLGHPKCLVKNAVKDIFIDKDAAWDTIHYTTPYLGSFGLKKKYI